MVRRTERLELFRNDMSVSVLHQLVRFNPWGRKDEDCRAVDESIVLMEQLEALKATVAMCLTKRET